MKNKKCTRLQKVVALSKKAGYNDNVHGTCSTKI
jgi:hypothetical protein